MELGAHTGNGFTILRQTWTEVANYGKIVEYLNNNELRILHQLSGEFVTGYRLGKLPLSRSPIELLENPDG